MTKKTVFDIVTERVIEVMEKGTIPWRKPWKGDGPQHKPQNIMGREYNGINFFLLSCLGFETPVFLTYKQIQERGGKINPGEEKKYFPVFFWKFNKYENTNAKGETEYRTVPICRYFLVYNISQTDLAIPEKFNTPVNTVAGYGTIEAAERIVNGYQNGPKVVIREGGNSAFYSPASDTVNVPHKDQFESLGEYYSTLFHELTHSTGHSTRLNRKELMDVNFFGSHDYSVEELVAEMGAAFLCNHVGIDNTVENSAAYIQAWMKNIKADPRMLMTAAGRAQKAFEYIVATDS